MKRAGILFAAFAVLLAVAWWAQARVFPSEADRIRRSLDDLAALLSFPEGEGNIAAVRRASAAADYFAPAPEIDIDVPGADHFRLDNRDEIQRLLLAARRFSPRVKLEFVDPRVDLEGGGQSAAVRLTAMVSVAGINRNQDELSALETRLQLRRIEGRWRITRAVTVPTLKQ